ncbi:ribosome silencing factor [soil metagenome]
MPATSSRSSDRPRPSRSRARTSSAPARSLARIAVEAALEKNAQDITVLDLRDISGEADFFILCSAQTDIQIRTIADTIIEQIKEDTGERPATREGYQNARWVLLDYFDVVVHIFDHETRGFYDLERLWGDAPAEKVSDENPEAQMLSDEPKK